MYLTWTYVSKIAQRIYKRVCECGGSFPGKCSKLCYDLLLEMVCTENSNFDSLIEATAVGNLVLNHPGPKPHHTSQKKVSLLKSTAQFPIS